jgi:hypothetical protein
MSSITENDRGYAENITGEVFITDQRPKFTGSYSDIYIGRFRNNAVRPQNAQVDKHEANASYQVAVKIIKLVRPKSLKAMQRIRRSVIK